MSTDMSTPQPMTISSTPAMPSGEDYSGYTKPIVKFWASALTKAREKRGEFDQIAEQCRSFYCKASSFMWDPEYLKKYVGKTITQPKFQITFNKAYEYVTIFTPMLFWEHAARKTETYMPVRLELDNVSMALAGGDPAATEWLTQLQQQEVINDARTKLREQVIGKYLDYSQRIQPGGLSGHSTLGIGDALLTGRGCLWTQAYTFPGSERTLTGSFWVSVDDILIDPDCKDVTLADARWIARRHRSHAWQIEKMFGIPEEILRSKSTLFSNNATPGVTGTTTRDMASNKDAKGDVIEWWEIYSRAGCGEKMCGNKSIDPLFDQELGENVYLCICPHLDFPLNIPAKDFDLLTIQDLIDATAWPTPYWKTNEWPLSNLDFVPRNGSDPWPLAPLAAALGEMTALNIMVSGYIQQCYENRQSIIAYLEGACENISGVLKGDQSPLPIPIKSDLQKPLQDLIHFMNRPESNGDPLRGIEFMLHRVEQITGLSELLYGNSTGGVARSAADANARQSNVSIRPDYMSKQVASWQTMVANKEKICAFYHVKATDISELLGPIGTEVWAQLVEQESDDSVLMNMHCYVEASEIRKPDRARDFSNMQQITQTIIPVLAAHATTTGDYEPLNNFMSKLGETMETDMTAFAIPSQQPPEPDPVQQQMQQEMQQVQLAEAQAKVEKIMAEAESIRMNSDPSIKMAESEHQMGLKQAELENKMAASQHAMALKSEQNQVALELKAQAAQLDLENKVEQHGLKLQAEGARSLQSLEHSDDLHQQALDHADDKAEQRLRDAQTNAFMKMINQGQMAAVRQTNRNNPQIGTSG